MNILHDIINEIKNRNPDYSIPWMDKYVLTELIELSQISGYEQIQKEAFNLLCYYKYEIDWEDNEVLNEGYKLPSKEKINEKHPKIEQAELLNYISNLNEAHLLKALNREYEGAFQLAKNNRRKQDIILTQLIIGDFESALKAQKEIADDFIKEDISLVIGLELYRQGKHDEAKHYLNDIIEKKNIFQNMWIAWVFEHRIPWVGYPLID
jgi:tetratricopeptide (TPR) repeat protein